MTRPTGRGIALLVAAAGIYLAARIVGTWELYLLAIAFFATAAASWLLVTMTARGLSAARSVTPDQPTVGDPLVFTVRVKNGAHLPGPQVSVADVTGGLDPEGAELQVESLPPRAPRVVTSPPRPALRGVHHLPALGARLEDPLGLARVDRRLGDPLDLTVYPRLIHLSSCALFPGMGARHERGRHGLTALGASEFRGVRPHNPGEPLSRIDWKATAKTGTLMLREMDDPTSGDVALLLDSSSPLVIGEPPETSLELAVQAAGSVADFALRAGRAVDLMLPQDEWRRLRVAPGAGGRIRLLESLARVQPHGSIRLGPSLRTLLARTHRRRRSHYVALVVMALDRELVRALIGLRDEGLQVSVVHIDAASFAPAHAAGRSAARTATAADAARAADLEGLSLSLAAAGVRCITLRRGDDLRSALSLGHAEAPYALVR